MRTKTPKQLTKQCHRIFNMAVERWSGTFFPEFWYKRVKRVNEAYDRYYKNIFREANANGIYDGTDIFNNFAVPISIYAK